MVQSAENGVTKRKEKPQRKRKKKKGEKNRHILLGDRLIKKGKYEQALAEYQKALKNILKETESYAE